jgi:prepilin-type N-terminal cleavage/methylation domain-containing protein
VRRGFTLIEVLLASTLTALIGVAVAQVLYVTDRAQDRVRERGTRRALLNALERRVRLDLNGLLPPGGLYAAGLVGQEADVGGGQGESLLSDELRSQAEAAELPAPIDARHQLTLAVFPPALAFGDEHPSGQGAAWQVVYYVDDDPETEERGLVRATTRIRDPLEGAEPEPVDTLSESVVGMSVAYFDGQDWAETWDSSASDTLPRAVEIRLAVIDGGEVVELRLTASPPTSRSGQVPEATP